jgi:hypothetical protein
MKKNQLAMAAFCALATLILIGFQNFTRYVPRDNSRDARELYMGDSLASALKEADRAERLKEQKKDGESKHEKIVEEASVKDQKTSEHKKIPIHNETYSR